MSSYTFHPEFYEAQGIKPDANGIYWLNGVGRNKDGKTFVLDSSGNPVSVKTGGRGPLTEAGYNLMQKRGEIPGTLSWTDFSSAFGASRSAFEKQLSTGQKFLEKALPIVVGAGMGYGLFTGLTAGAGAAGGGGGAAAGAGPGVMGGAAEIAAAGGAAAPAAGAAAGAGAGGILGTIGNIANVVGTVGSLATTIFGPKPSMPGEPAGAAEARARQNEELARADAALNAARKRSQRGLYGPRAFRTSALDRLGNTLFLTRAGSGQRPARPGGYEAAPTLGAPNILTPVFGAPGRGLKILRGR